MSLGPLPSALLLPPVNLLLATAGGMALATLARRPYWRRAGRWLAGLALAGVLMLSLPIVADPLLAELETGLPARDGVAPGAIVILGGDMRQSAHGGWGLGALSLERVRAGAALARRTGLPILVSGGPLEPGAPSVAELMARSLAEDFSTPARWVEPDSADTWANAVDSTEMLRAAGIDAAWLVTHPWHMRRALIAFHHAGLPVRPDMSWQDKFLPSTLDELVPQPRALLVSYYALHEWIGCAAYALRAAL